MLAAQILSILGSAIAAIAIPWLLLETDAGPEKISLVFAAQSCAAIFAAVLATPFLDRMEKKKVYIACDVFLALGSFALISLYSMRLLNVATVIAILASTAIIKELSGAAGSAMIPELLANDKINNQRINGLIGTFHNFGDLAGPAIGGLVIAGIGTILALALDGISFLMSALILLLFIPKFNGGTDQQCSSETATGNDYWTGVKEIARSPVLRMVTLISAIINMVITPLLVLLLPVMVKENGGTALGVGTMMSCFGIGTFLASVLYTVQNGNMPPLPSLLGSVLLALMSCILIPMTQGSTIYVFLFLIGISVGYLGPLEQTLMQNNAPPSQIGRIMLAYSAFRTLLVPIGFFITGQTLTLFSVSATFMALAALLAIAVVSLIYSLIAETPSWSAGGTE